MIDLLVERQQKAKKLEIEICLNKSQKTGKFFSWQAVMVGNYFKVIDTGLPLKGFFNKEMDTNAQFSPLKEIDCVYKLAEH